MGPIRARRSRLAREDGAVAVEFALVLPIILVIVFGIINFGVVFSQQSTLNNAVREGARRAVPNDPYPSSAPGTSPRSCDEILASIKNQLAGLALNVDEVEVRVTQPWPTTQACGDSWAKLKSSFGSAYEDEEPCKGSFDSSTNTSRSIVVETRYLSGLLVSFPPFPTDVTLTSKAVYRCEFD